MHLRKLIPATLGSLLFALPLATRAQAPAATPDPKAAPRPVEIMAKAALWSVQNGKSTLYLFGSVHVMKPTVMWKTPIITSAFKASDALYLELADVSESAGAAMQPLVMKYGVDAEHPLSTKISKEDVAALDAALKEMGAPGESAVEPLQPWLASVSLSMLPMTKAGYVPSSGIDRTLQEDATKAGKPVKGLETPEEQFKTLAELPQSDQVIMLHETLEDLPKGPAKINEMVDDWIRGDVEKIAALENDDMKKYAALYDRLLVKRNVGMADKLVALLTDAKGGTEFVAIGAAHLAGPDSVLAILEKRGYKAKRIQ